MHQSNFHASHSGVRAHSSKATFAVFLCGVLAFLNLYATQPILHLLEGIFRSTESQVGMTVSAGTLGVAFSAIPTGVFAERSSRKKVIVGAALLTIIPTAFSVAAGSVFALSFCHLILGFLAPGIFVVTTAFITEEWPPSQVPKVMSIYVGGTAVGGYLGREISGCLSEPLGWRMAFTVLAAISTIGACLLWMVLPSSAIPAQKNTLALRSVLRPLWLNLKNIPLIATCLNGFSMLFTLVSTFTYITFRFSNAPYLFSARTISTICTVYLTGLLAAIIAGRFLTRIGLRAGMLGAIVIGVVGIFMTLSPSIIVIAFGLSLVSSCVFVAQTCANSFIRDAAPISGRTSAVGIYIMFYYLGGTAGGVVPAMVWRTAHWAGCVGLIFVALLVAFVATFFGWPKRSCPIPL